MFRSYFSLLIIAIMLQGCVKSKAKEIQVVTADEIKNNVRYNSTESNPDLTKEDFKKSHLVNAENIVANKGLRDELNDVDKESPIAIYFTTENKLNEAALILQDLGFQQIYILDGGIKKWSNDKHIIK